MSDPLYAIVLAAVDLKIAAPTSYDRLVDAFKAFEQQCSADLHAAGSDVILGVQARSCAVRDLRIRLEDCITIRAQIEGRQRGPTDNRR
jgi:hypothetical protein